MNIECYCDEDQGAGYTYNDEHGDCPVCEGLLDSDEEIKEYLNELRQSYRLYLDIGLKEDAKAVLELIYKIENSE